MLLFLWVAAWNKVGWVGWFLLWVHCYKGSNDPFKTPVGCFYIVGVVYELGNENRVYWGLFATQLCGYYFISHDFLDPYEKTKIQWNGLVGKCLQVQLGEVVWCPNKSIFPSLLETIIFTSPKSDFLSGLDRWSLDGASREGNPKNIQSYLRISV